MNKTKFLGILTIICFCFGAALLTDLPKFLKYQKGDIKDYATVQAGEAGGRARRKAFGGSGGIWYNQGAETPLPVTGNHSRKSLHGIHTFRK